MQRRSGLKREMEEGFCVGWLTGWRVSGRNAGENSLIWETLCLRYRMTRWRRSINCWLDGSVAKGWGQGWRHSVRICHHRGKGWSQGCGWDFPGGLCGMKRGRLKTNHLNSGNEFGKNKRQHRFPVKCWQGLWSVSQALWAPSSSLGSVSPATIFSWMNLHH